MPRLSRAENMARTREKLLKSAFELYLKHGYESVKIDQIAENAGFSRGAFYAHFSSKDAIYIQLAVKEARKIERDLIYIVKNSKSRDAVIDAICEWVDQGSLSNEISYLVIKIIYHSKDNNTLSNDDFSMLRSYWHEFGTALARFFPENRLPGTPEEIGATILLVLADGSFVERAGGPRTSRMLRITLEAFLR